MIVDSTFSQRTYGSSRAAELPPAACRRGDSCQVIACTLWLQINACSAQIMSIMSGRNTSRQSSFLAQVPCPWRPAQKTPVRRRRLPSPQAHSVTHTDTHSLSTPSIKASAPPPPRPPPLPRPRPPLQHHGCGTCCSCTCGSWHARVWCVSTRGDDDVRTSNVFFSVSILGSASVSDARKFCLFLASLSSCVFFVNEPFALLAGTRP